MADDDSASLTAPGCTYRIRDAHGVSPTGRPTSGFVPAQDPATGPNGAAGEEFFFPDGDGALQSVDGVTAGIERGGAVRRADGDEDAGVADFQPTEAVDDR